VVVCLSALFGRVQAVRERLPNLQHVLVTNIKEYFPVRLRLLFTLAKERKDGHRVQLPCDGRTSSLGRVMARARANDPGVDVHADDLALLQYTGGTTGVAKAAMLSHRNLVANTPRCARGSEPGRADGGDGDGRAAAIYAITTIELQHRAAAHDGPAAARGAGCAEGDRSRAAAPVPGACRPCAWR
jgi:acyl-CoA synthetase (AMP-forming)/AMP-acid ligase II